MFAVLAVSTQMSTPLEKFEQQYAAEVVKVDADEDLLKRLERGIRGLKGVAEFTGQCSVKAYEWMTLMGWALQSRSCFRASLIKMHSYTAFVQQL